MQLVAYGAQDIYLTGNPQITFFKVVYRRHTNFSMESIQQTLNGSSGFGGRCTATISRNGDLISRMYVEHIVGAVPNLAVGGGVTIANNYGHALLREVELEIGGQKIDKHFGRLMQTYWRKFMPKRISCFDSTNSRLWSISGCDFISKNDWNRWWIDRCRNERCWCSTIKPIYNSITVLVLSQSWISITTYSSSIS